MPGAFSRPVFVDELAHHAQGSGGSKHLVVALIGTAAAIAFVSTFSATVRIWRGFLRAKSSAFHPPQAILVLGGDKTREHIAAKFAAACAERSLWRISSPEAHSSGIRLLPVYISSGHDDVAQVMRHAGVHPSRLKVDNRALDTVTNFTSMLSTFQKAQYTHVYIVTSDYHVRRASMLATLIFRSHGIAFTFISTPSAGQSQGRAQRRGGAGTSKQDSEASRTEPSGIRQRRRIPDGAAEASSEASSAASSPTTAQTRSTSSSALSQGSSGTPWADPESRARASHVEELGAVEPETRARFERDRLRAVIWLLTGWHGAELLRFTRPERYTLHKQKPLHHHPAPQ